MERAATPSLVPDEALLAILLKTGVRGLDVRKLSLRLLEAFGSLKSLVSADWRSLEAQIQTYNKSHPHSKISGIGRVKCLELAAAFEMGRRWARLSPDEIRSIKVDSSAEAYRVFKTVYSSAEECESLYVLPVDASCHPVCEPINIVRGSGCMASFTPKDVFKEAVRWSAYAIIVAHNHPSGNITPSDEDFIITHNLCKVAEVMGIPLLDHLILGCVNLDNKAYISLRESYPTCFDSQEA